MARIRLGTLALLLSVALLAASVTLGQTAEELPLPEVPRLVLKNARLIDGTGALTIDSAWVRIEGEHIAAIGGGTPPCTPGAQVIDLEGQTILPGLIDTHVHLGYLTQARWMAKLLLAYGVTTVRDTGIRLGTLAAIRRWAEGQEAVPRMSVSGRILSGSQEELRFLKEGGTTPVTVLENVAFGVDFLKTHNWVSSQALRQIAGFAEQHDLYVAGHVPLSMTSIAAIDAGLKILMHTSTLRASEVLDDPELVARYPIDLPYPLRWGYWAHFNPNAEMLRRTLDAWEKRRDDFFFEPTLAVLKGVASNNDPEIHDKPELQSLVSPLWQEYWKQAPLAAWGSDLTEEQIIEAKAAVASMVAFTGLAHARGTRLVTGSDTGGSPPWVVPGDSLHQELELLVEAGVSPIEAVRSATGTAAEALRVPDRGVIAAGKLADLVIVRGDVAGDISAIREVEQVMLGGRLYERAQLLNEAAEWAAAHQSPPGE